MICFSQSGKYFPSLHCSAAPKMRRAHHLRRIAGWLQRLPMLIWNVGFCRQREGAPCQSNKTFSLLARLSRYLFGCQRTNDLAERSAQRRNGEEQIYLMELARDGLSTRLFALQRIPHCVGQFSNFLARCYPKIQSIASTYLFFGRASKTFARMFLGLDVVYARAQSSNDVLTVNDFVY